MRSLLRALFFCLQISERRMNHGQRTARNGLEEYRNLNMEV